MRAVGKTSDSLEHAFVAKAAGGKEEWSLSRIAAIYGANASGKTNLIMALQTMRHYVKNSASPEGNKTLTPFLFDDQFSGAPSEFEASFIADSVRYQYGFSADKTRVVSERLFAFPQNRRQILFERKYNTADKGYEWNLGPALKGEKELWKKSTRDAALFLSTAVNLNSGQLKIVADWFDSARFTLGKAPGFFSTVTPSMIEQGAIKKEDVLCYLKEADLDIVNFDYEEKSLLELAPAEIPESARTALREAIAAAPTLPKWYDITTTHETKSGKKTLPFSLESDGTHKMLSLAGTWIDMLGKGGVIAVDELGTHLHPHLLRYLARQFNDPTTNPNNAQLIFTTHDPALLRGDLLHRDQVWFCEKDKEQATQLYSLADFKTRGENKMAAYLSGRYGATPVV